MAAFFLKARELDQKLLPKVCLICGEKGPHRKVELKVEVNVVFNRIFRKNYHQYRLRKCWLPLCSDHAEYFDDKFPWWTLLVIGLVVLFMLFMALGGVVLKIDNPLFFFGGFCFIVSVILGTAAASWVIGLGSTRPTLIDNDGIDMVNLHDEFMDAVEDARDDRERARREARRARRREEDR